MVGAADLESIAATALVPGAKLSLFDSNLNLEVVRL